MSQQIWYAKNIAGGAAGLYFGHGTDAARRMNVAIVLLLMAANYGVRAAARRAWRRAVAGRGGWRR